MELEGERGLTRAGNRTHKQKKKNLSFKEMEGRMPPHHIEAERSVLGAILVHNDSIDLVRDVGLEARDFYLDAHRKIFESAMAVAEKRQPVDLVTLTAMLRDRGHFEEVGGTSTLTSLFDDAFAIGNVVHYAKLVRDKAVVREMIHVCGDIISNAFEGVEDTEAFVDESESNVFKVGTERASAGFTELKKILIDNMTSIEELSLGNKDITGLETGFVDFDKMTTGLHPGQILIIGARPGMGKTSWFSSALQHASIKKQAVVALFSLEMSKEELGFRFLSGMARIDSKSLKVGRLKDRDWQRLAEAADQLSKSKIFIDDSGGLTVMDVRSRCRRLMSSEKKLDLIVIDYLQLMKGSKAAQRGDGSREREISEISRNLKELAKELKVPIIVLAQLNRGVESRQDKRPSLSDLRESGAIEQDADIVCFIHREDYYNKDTENKGIAEFIVAKNRSGPTDTVQLGWQDQYTLFVNLSHDKPGMPIRRPQGYDPEDIGFD